ncbi:unnamed protein product, partial [Staurois parvus]
PPPPLPPTIKLFSLLLQNCNFAVGGIVPHHCAASLVSVGGGIVPHRWCQWGEE